MNITALRERILHEPNFITSELETFRTYYELKHTLRWGDSEPVLNQRESVAEHVYGMQLLAQYFLPLHTEYDLSLEHIATMITWHDIAEAITRDMTSQTKTDSHRTDERAAETDIIGRANPVLSPVISAALREYDTQETMDARFTKALDKLEPMVHMYFVTKKDGVAEKNMEWPVAEYRKYRKPYFANFPLLDAYDEVLEKGIKDSGFFPK